MQTTWSARLARRVSRSQRLVRLGLRRRFAAAIRGTYTVHMGKISSRYRQAPKSNPLPWVIAAIACLVAAWAVVTRPSAPSQPIRQDDPLVGTWVVVKHREAKRIGKRVDVADGVVRIDGIGMWKYRWDGPSRILWGPLELPFGVRFEGDRVYLDGGDSVSEWQRQ